jgi:capsular exopolysaccharide synthesis family protein
MGYVFDAMNRGDDDELRPEQAGQPSDAPTPAEPVDGFDGTESAAAPSDASDIPTPVSDQHDTSWQPLPDEYETPVYNFSEARSAQAPTPPREPDQIEHTAPAPKMRIPIPAAPLRITPQWSRNLDDRLVSLTEPSSQLAEEYRAIRTSLLARWEHRRHLVHTITSATPQEGKTITSLNLGLSMAELRNRKTIVIEADLRLPTFNKLMHLGDSPGMIGYLRGQAELSEVIQKIEGSALHVITAGSRASNDAVQLLSNNRMARLLETLRAKYDHVIIDTPPVIELADAGILGGISDEVMLIARISRTPKPLIDQALRALRSYNAPVAGVIATDQDRGRNRYHYYRYGYRYRYRYYAKRAA